MCGRLLELCARIDGHAEQHAMLHQLGGEVKTGGCPSPRPSKKGRPHCLVRAGGTYLWIVPDGVLNPFQLARCRIFVRGVNRDVAANFLNNCSSSLLKVVGT